MLKINMVIGKEPKLRRELGLWKTTLSGIGVILGAGVYALIGKAAGLSGNAAWMSFLIAALVAGFTGLSYAELSSLFPGAGAEYEYSRKAFGKGLAFLIGWLIFIGGFTSGATVALGFGGYFSALFGTPAILAAIGIIILVSAVILYGIRQSAWVAAVFTVVETVGLLIIIFIGAPHLGTVNYFEVPDLGGLFEASALIFFAYLGFEGISRLSEEAKEPKKTIPRAILLSLLVTTILYVLVAVAAVSVMDWEVLGTSGAPLADVAAVAFGGNAFLIVSVIALFSTANTVLIFLLVASRIVYGMGKSGAFPSVFGRVHAGRRTPWVSILILTVLTIVFVLPGEIELAADLTNFAVFVTFMVINASLIKLRYRNHDRRAFRVPLNIGKVPVPAVLGFATSLFLLVNLGMDSILYGIGLMAIGLGVQKIWKK